MNRLILLLLGVAMAFIVSAQETAQSDSVLNYTDINGMKQGLWKKSYYNGKPKFEAYFVNNIPVGELKRYDNEGRLYAHLVYDEKGEKASAKFYYKNGKVAGTGFYVGKIKDSTWNYYNSSGVRYLQESFKNGAKHGVFQQLTSEGVLMEEKTWKNDTLHGPWRKFYTNGKPMWEGNYVNGMLEGSVKSYYKSGVLYREGQFENDLMEGEWKSYKSNGSLEKVYHYKDGKSPQADDEQNKLLEELQNNKGKYFGPQNSNDIDWLRGRNY